MITGRRVWRVDTDSKFQRSSQLHPWTQRLSSAGSLRSTSSCHYWWRHARWRSARTAYSAASTPERRRTNGHTRRTPSQAPCTPAPRRERTRSSPPRTCPPGSSPRSPRTLAWLAPVSGRRPSLGSTATQISARRCLGSSGPGPDQRNATGSRIKRGSSSFERRPRWGAGWTPFR